MIKINKKIPLPPKRSRMFAAPFDQMKVGDSFEFDGQNRTNLYVYAIRAGIEITIRRDGDVFRVWRVK